jgi:hypothetical protein
MSRAIYKEVEVNGKQQIVSFYYLVGERIEEKSYMKKAKWGTFIQKEYTNNCLFFINGEKHHLQTLLIELAGGGYSRYFIVDGIKFNDSHKNVIEYLLNKNFNK